MGWDVILSWSAPWSVPHLCLTFASFGNHVKKNSELFSYHKGLVRGNWTNKKSNFWSQVQTRLHSGSTVELYDLISARNSSQIAFTIERSAPFCCVAFNLLMAKIFNLIDSIIIRACELIINYSERSSFWGCNAIIYEG